MCWMRRAASDPCEPSSIVQRRFGVTLKQCEVLYEEFREPCPLRNTGGIFSMVGLAVHRACHGVLGFTMNDGMKDCEVLISGDVAPARQSREV